MTIHALFIAILAFTISVGLLWTANSFFITHSIGPLPPESLPPANLPPNPNQLLIDCEYGGDNIAVFIPHQMVDPSYQWTISYETNSSTNHPDGHWILRAVENSSRIAFIQSVCP